MSTDSGHGRRAIVIGGSLGGLTAGALLQRAGWRVTVFERSHVPLTSAGAGIVVHEATVRHFLEDRGFSIDEVSCGVDIGRVYGPGDAVLFEEPSGYRFTSWPLLYARLLESVGRENYVLAATMSGLEQTPSGARAVFTSGQVEEADLIVCADGVSSTARPLLFGEVKQSYAGYVGWRGLVSARRLSAPARYVLPVSISYGIVPNSHVVAYPIPNHETGVPLTPEIVNYVWYRNVAEEDLAVLMTATDGTHRPLALQPGMVRPEAASELREAALDMLPPILAEMVVQTPRPFLQVILDMESPRMVEGRIAVMGDAASVARPHAGAGTAKAAENAWNLVSALAATEGDVDTALRSWETSQLELGHNLVARSADIGRRAQMTNTWIPGDPDLRFGLYGPGR